MKKARIVLRGIPGIISGLKMIYPEHVDKTKEINKKDDEVTEAVKNKKYGLAFMLKDQEFALILQRSRMR